MRRHLTLITIPALLATALVAEGGAARAGWRLAVSVPVDGSSIAAAGGREHPAQAAAPSPQPSAAAAEVPPPAGPPTVASSVGQPADLPSAEPLAGAAQIAARAGVNGPEREEGEDAITARREGGNGAPGSAEPAFEEAPAPETVAAESGDAPRAAQARSPAELGIAIDPLAGPTGQSPEVPLAEAVAQAEERLAKPLHLLHGEVPPGTAQRLSWSATELFEGVPIATPVLVVNGRLPGPTLCLTAAVHGDELNGIEMVRRVMHNLEAKELSGAVIGVPIVNLQGFRSGSRYLPDRRDLNRYFPGNPQGSQASRIAFSFFTEVVTHCDALIDLHTGSFERANLPQLRADLRNPDVVTLTQGFGATVILHSDPAEGTLRWAATRAGVPAVTLEAGGPTELEIKEVMHGVKGIETLLHTLGMVKDNRFWGDPEPVYYQSTWVRASSGGILLADVSLGSTVERGDLLGTITDPMSNDRTNLYSPFSGRIIGMARNQVVMPGFAAFHVGIQAAEARARQEPPPSPEDAALEHATETDERDYLDAMSE
ncbi:MAG TPA: succinylglutamate desuccinylase/aspartoacylase family protein [Woeseiaceae bacterium]